MCSCPPLRCCGWYLLSLCTWSPCLQHLTVDTCWAGESSCFLHVCSSCQMTKIHGGFQGGGRICYEKWHSSVPGRTSSRLTAVWRGGQVCSLLWSVLLGTSTGKYCADRQLRAVSSMSLFCVLTITVLVAMLPGPAISSLVSWYLVLS